MEGVIWVECFGLGFFILMEEVIWVELLHVAGVWLLGFSASSLASPPAWVSPGDWVGVWLRFPWIVVEWFGRKCLTHNAGTHSIVKVVVCQKGIWRYASRPSAPPPPPPPPTGTRAASARRYVALG